MSDQYDDPYSGYPQPIYSPESGLLWAGTEGQIVNAGVYFLCLLFCWLVVPVIYAMYRCLKTVCHTYRLTDQRLQESSGILFRQTDKLELYRAKGISIQQTLLQRMLGHGCVVLLTSDRSTLVVVLNVISDPHAVARTLRDCVERCRIAKGVREID
ncbi:PH domain-containing protein [Noviherbaspirillum sp.]|uniref:PH domain-containing protein n=1 Tax=Noviherbaspirillum sp. TaxID=1926288 RepID=UPI002B464855|nr:PH domain-containing protein [Noviherbaspirillum sp.]HJV79499.1 PH domain-containing protein [Noviherbaspirillum sp.]